MYFDEEEGESNEVKLDNENGSGNSEEDGYGGYNEYGECDRGYYYRDGRYERKTSPMMSPHYLSGNRLGELLGELQTRLSFFFFESRGWLRYHAPGKFLPKNRGCAT
jgi:hypothetical protein